MKGVYISEIHPNPIDGFEWVELYNDSTEVISTSRIKVFDITGKNLRLINESILPNSYITATASSILNNGGDTVVLEVDGTIIETITYGEMSQGKSYMRCGTTWISNAITTYRSENICEEPATLHLSAVPSPKPNAEITAIEPTPFVSTYQATTMVSSTLKPISFQDKHRIIPTSFQSDIVATTESKLPPQLKKGDVGTMSALAATGIFSFIQSVFLVYLIMKRVQFNTSQLANTKHEK